MFISLISTESIDTFLAHTFILYLFGVPFFYLIACFSIKMFSYIYFIAYLTFYLVLRVFSSISLFLLIFNSFEEFILY